MKIGAYDLPESVAAVVIYWKRYGGDISMSEERFIRFYDAIPMTLRYTDFDDDSLHIIVGIGGVKVFPL